MLYATSYATADAPTLMQLTDLNHDGKLDLVVAGSCSVTCGFYTILLGKGDGTFTQGQELSPGGSPNAFAVSDLNGDGKLDLVFAVLSDQSQSGGDGGAISVLLGKGDGTMGTPTNVATHTAIGGLAAGDLTGDKVPDLVISDFTYGSVYVLKGNGDGTFQTEQTVPSNRQLGSYFLQLLDLNHDGNLDLALITEDALIAVLLGNGDCTFQPSKTYLTGSEPRVFAAADVNGDGNIDLAVNDRYGNYAAVLLGNGDGTLGPSAALSP